MPPELVALILGKLNWLKDPQLLLVCRFFYRFFKSHSSAAMEDYYVPLRPRPHSLMGQGAPARDFWEQPEYVELSEEEELLRYSGIALTPTLIGTDSWLRLAEFNSVATFCLRNNWIFAFRPNFLFIFHRLWSPSWSACALKLAPNGIHSMNSSSSHKCDLPTEPFRDNLPQDCKKYLTSEENDDIRGLPKLPMFRKWYGWTIRSVHDDSPMTMVYHEADERFFQVIGDSNGWLNGGRKKDGACHVVPIGGEDVIWA
ncbi:hypothetical protein PAPYR_3582 [Paratrimastix pyriformis]|uniref:F-box domain-containing protein n=1 Tax=Paratrimastix pyriformis TaxID=342808 RepID=A0ABQ8UN21_9EUKA|nr:hypothetical protein PAPYR_3582 [Paratrimastix pyriformis]